MNKDQVKGIIDEVAGTAKRKAGELTDNLRWSRLFGQVFRVFKWNNCSS
jgi:hypothetical protein